MSVFNMMLDGGGSGGGSVDLKTATSNSGGTSIWFSVENEPNEYVFLSQDNVRSTNNTHYVHAVVDTADYKVLCYFYNNTSTTRYDSTNLSSVTTSYSNQTFILTFAEHAVSGASVLFYW